MKLLKSIIAIGVMTAITGTASALPASKATFAYDGLIDLPASTTGNPDSGWTTVLKSQIKTANQKDLFINPSLQCGIVTDTTVKSLNGSTDSAEARGTIRVRVLIDGSEYAVPNNSGRDATGGAEDPDGLVYCDRVQSLKAKFSGLNCKVELNEASENYGKVTCDDPEELQLILKTLNANSFNFLAPNVSSGVHTIEVQAKTTAQVSTVSANGSMAGAEAFIGAGSVTVQEVRMIKGNDGTTIDLE